jgi:plasmid stabilization system protein ParE
MAKRPARLSKSALRWLEREIGYLAEKSPSAAKKLAQRIRDARTLLAEHPKGAQIGRIAGTRRFVVGPYVLSVRENDGVTEIVAIGHGRQGDAYAPKELLNEDPPAEPDDGSSFNM